jgi:acyl carrier protein
MSTLGEMRQLAAYVKDGDVKPETNFRSIRLDELDQEEVARKISDAFAVQLPAEAAKWNTPLDFINHIAAHPQAK